MPWQNGFSPFIYIDDDPDTINLLNMEEEAEEEDLNNDETIKYQRMPVKRLKVYRRYPWKRQNNR